MDVIIDAALFATGENNSSKSVRKHGDHEFRAGGRAGCEWTLERPGPRAILHKRVGDVSAPTALQGQWVSGSEHGSLGIMW